jgi:hypothetical protein
MRVRVHDMTTREVREYALSRDNWRNAWAACTDSGAVVMWVPEELMEPHVQSVLTSGRRWRKIIAGTTAWDRSWERDMDCYDVNDWYTPDAKENT